MNYRVDKYKPLKIYVDGFRNEGISILLLSPKSALNG